MALLVVGIVSSAAGYGTMSYFNDTETAQDNTMNAGTVDIDLNRHNPWSENFTIELKPSQHPIWTGLLQNVGDNPVKVYKHINVTETGGGMHPEPEWNVDPDNSGDLKPGDVDYGLHIEVMNESGHEIGQGDIYMSTVTLKDVNSTKIQLYPNPAIQSTHDEIDLPDNLPPGWQLHVTQRYHIQSSVGNEAQGDTLLFDMEYLATQTNAPEPTPAAP